MTPENVFSFCNTLVLPGWILLLVLPRWKFSDHIITGIIVTILALFYCYFIFTNLHPSDFKSFNTLGGVMGLFTKDEAVLAGWIHYLAFDLMTGLFIVKNAQKHKVNHWLLLPCLFLTFMLGPCGLLFYFIIRMICTKQYFPSNY
ncbi:MAG: DUF4281 domain-containing protein [Chitinophagaceae bacterium]|nr:DUF4281 domain-containing protein [Chitinophagaceae bacterium]